MTWALLGMCVMLSMTVTSPYLCGPVNDPHVAGGLVDDPCTNYLHGLVDDPRVAGGPVNDPHIHIIATHLQEFPQDQPVSLWAESKEIRNLCKPKKSSLAN